MRKSWTAYLAIYIGLGVIYALWYASRAQTTTRINGVPVTSAIGENISASLWVRLIATWPGYVGSDLYHAVMVPNTTPPVTGGNLTEDI